MKEREYSDSWPSGWVDGAGGMPLMEQKNTGGGADLGVGKRDDSRSLHPYNVQ